MTNGHEKHKSYKGGASVSRVNKLSLSLEGITKICCVGSHPENLKKGGYQKMTNNLVFILTGRSSRAV